MNSDTLWLQVPAAERPLLKQIDKAYTADRLEDIGASLITLQGNSNPHIDETTIILFIAEQGLTLESKKHLPPYLLTEAINTFSTQSKTHRLIEKTLQAKLEIINLGNTKHVNAIAGMINSNIASSTANFSHKPAMSSEHLAKAINIGRQTAQRIKLSGAQLFIASEVNNTNTLSATAITCALLNIPAKQLCKPDTEKNKLIHQALTKHKEQLTSPLNILRYLGSFEIAALTGSYLCCAHMGMPVLINNIASTVAALITARICPQAEKWFLYSQSYDDPTHALILQTLKAQPLLQLKIKLDDLAGIITTLSLLQLACRNQDEIMRFSEERLLKRYS